MLIQQKSILQSLLSSFGLGLILLMLLFNVNIVSATNRTDQTSELFLKAIDYGDLDTAQSLLNSGADINYTHGGTTHALALAVNWHRGTKYTTPEIVQFLLSRGANINARYGHEKNDNSGNKTPLMRAIQSDYSSDQIRLMYIANGADIHAEDSFGNSVLAHAVVHLHFTQSADGIPGKNRSCIISSVFFPLYPDEVSMLALMTTTGIGRPESLMAVSIDSVLPQPVGPMIRRLFLYMGMSGLSWLWCIRMRWEDIAVATARTPSSCPTIFRLMMDSICLGLW